MNRFFTFSFKPMSLIVGFLFISYSCNSTTESDQVEEEVRNVASADSADITSDPNSIEDLVNTKDETKLNESQLKVQGLLEACVANDYASAATFIMYRGKDQARMGYDSFNYSNANEANTVKVTCDVIVSWLGTSQSYEFISFQEEETEFGLQYVVEVMFKQEKLGLERHFFYLMDTPKGKLLVNMV